MIIKLLTFIGVLGIVLSQNDGVFELNIVHFNDFHAHFDETSPTGTTCMPEQESCIGGYARLYTAINQAIEVEPDSIVLNGGDTFQGTIWYNFLRWNVSQHFMNMIPHDAHVLGNHEFDHGVEGLLPYLERLKAPMLGANVNTTFEPDIAKYVQNHTIIVRKGRQIGVIGVLLRSFSAPIGGIKMEDELMAINREAAILTGKGVDIIILLSHVGFDSDRRLAQRVSRDVDIIVGAHSHTLLYTGGTPDGSTPLGEYPTVVTRDDGHRIPIVQASCYTRYLGIIKLYINDAGIIKSWEGQPIYLGSSIVQDPHILELLEPWRQEVDAVGKEVLGSSLVTLNRWACYRGECNMGNWVCDGFLEEVMLMRPTLQSRWHNAHVCMVNAGGLRTQIDSGNITTEGVLRAIPFENYVQIFDLKGKYLLEALEFAVGVTVSSSPEEFYSARMVQIGGMRNTYNVSMPVNSRVTATIRCIDCDVPKYLPLDENATYTVATQSYMGDGGGGYSMISKNRENIETLKMDYQMLQDYIRRQGVVFQDLDGRIQIVS